MTDYKDFEGLQNTGFSSFEPTKPEDEFFHSVYISGQTRKNHIGIEEQAGKIQVRGVQYNLDKVYMVITHTKDVLVKTVTRNARESIDCFSFKNTNPWVGSSKLADGSNRVCPQTSPERANNDFCNPCRTQIIVAGILCKQDGSPVLKEDRKPVFVFIRGKGIKFNNVSTYLSELYKEELTPIFEPVTEKSKEFEKQVVNNKRFVTEISKGQASSKHGMKDVFVLTKGQMLPKESVLAILKLSKTTLENFNEKFDWSKNRGAASSEMQSEALQEAEGIMSLDIGEQAPQEQSAESKPQKTFSFDDIQF